MHIVDGTKLGSGSKQKVTSDVRALFKALGPLLDDRFALIHTLSISGRRERVDALLVGPHGALVLNADGSSGRCRCLGDRWYIWDKKTQDFFEAESSPLRELKQGLNLVESYLTGQGMGTTVPMQAALVFVNPKLQLEHMEPSVPLVEFAQIKTLAEELSNSPVYIEKREIEKVLSLFGAAVHVASTRQAPAPAPEAGESEQSSAPRSSGWMQQRGLLGLKRWQLVLMGGILAAYGCMLAAGLYFVLR